MMPYSRPFWLALACLTFFAVLSSSVSAVTVDPEQKEILYRIRDEMPSLETLSSLPWTNASIDDICNTFKLFGVQSCNSAGWVTVLVFNGFNPPSLMPPSLGDMKEVITFSVSNSFSGPFLPSLGNLTHLVALEFLFSPLLSGPIPNEWKSFKSLRTFSWTHSTGPQILPDWIDEEWPELTKLNLQYLSLSGPFPAWLAARSNMAAITLSNNAFSGVVPESLTNLPLLKSLALNKNQFEGPLPSDWRNATSLEVINLSDNLFSGDLPEISPPNIDQLYAVKNSFSGSIPQSWLDGSITMLDLSSNALSGALTWPSNPATSQLTIYTVSSNRGLDGSLPANLWRVGGLIGLYITDTQITGPIPEDVRPGCALEYFQAANAPIGGSLPPNLGLCTSLRALDLTNTSLTGVIPATTKNIVGAQSLRLGYNDLNGTLFEDWSKLINLLELRVSRNQLSGTVPKSLLDLARISNLYLDNNHLDLCGDGSLKNNSVYVNLARCDVSGQYDLQCGCAGVWTRCLAHEMLAECPSPGDIPPNEPSYEPSTPGSTTPEPTTPTELGAPTGASASTHALPSWLPTQSNSMVAIIASMACMILFVSF